MSRENLYISFNEYINVKEYKAFLKNIYYNLEFGKNIYGLSIFKNKNMCNCNIDSLKNITYLTRGTNDIYSANIIVLLQHQFSKRNTLLSSRLIK